MSEGDDLEVVRGSDNVFRDLGHPEADLLQMKADLAAKIIHELEAQQLSVRAASALTGHAAADFSRVRRAKVQGFTLDKLVGMLGKLDREVELSVRLERRQHQSSLRDPHMVSSSDSDTTNRHSDVDRLWSPNLNTLGRVNAMKQPGLDHRHRDITGEIRKKNSNTLVGTLRKEYGDAFAKGYRSDAQLGTVLKQEGAKSLSQLLKK